ncbi:divergent polysaccharide deacetylase family protein [Pacificimonas flava]|uniref:Putative periplasmic protein YibQ n=1 Tax=Pacificimonas flava TaxID=1234595 RepID=M2TJC4_9SPHN|nr:divergent polysaccharide deacetylase family protein [Pacificimonas flava]EMD81741.1 Putative periplasmic protein YibQ [Pacificimonas flava]MBB5279311.1 hypothetical protein [Pacificimonas flava]
MAERKAASPLRIILVTALGALAFVALAALFAHLLQPMSPAKANLPDGAAEHDDDAAVPEQIAASSADMSGRRDEDAGRQADAEAGAADTKPPATAPLPDGPLLAIVVTELGFNPASDRAAIERLPEGISFTFTPYAEGARALAEAARQQGHDAFLSVPMEPVSYPRVSPGRHTLLRRADADANREALEWALGRFGSLDGVTGMMGSGFTQDEAALAPIMAALGQKDLVFIDQKASPRSVADRVARDAGVPARANDIFLDEPATEASVRRRLDGLIAKAKARGYAIGYARPIPVSVDALAELSARAEAEGITLIGAARLARGLAEDG